MTPLIPLDPHFPCLSPDSADPCTISAARIAEELTRELEARRMAYPRRVEKGQMHQYDADRQIDLLHAVRDDFSWLELFAISKVGEGADPAPALTEKREAAEAAILKYRWSEIVAELRREILLRRRFYPRWIAAGTLDRASARRQMERIEAAHFAYWRNGRYFMPDDLHRLRDRIFPAHRNTPEFALYRQAAHAHFARFAALGRRGDYAAAPPADDEPRLAFA